jgi:hypothetical protein
MKLDIPDEYLPLIITALEHYDAYTRAAQRQDTGVLETKRAVFVGTGSPLSARGVIGRGEKAILRSH